MSSDNPLDPQGSRSGPAKRPPPRRKGPDQTPAASPGVPAQPGAMRPSAGAGSYTRTPVSSQMQPAATPLAHGATQPGQTPTGAPGAKGRQEVPDEELADEGSPLSGLWPLLLGGVFLFLALLGLAAVLAVKWSRDRDRAEPVARAPQDRPTEPEAPPPPDRFSRRVAEGPDWKSEPLPVLTDGWDDRRGARRDRFREPGADDARPVESETSVEQRGTVASKPLAEAVKQSPAEAKPAEMPVDPFSDLPDTVDLPELPASAADARPAVLGLVHLPASGDPAFELVNAPMTPQGVSFRVEPTGRPRTARVTLAAGSQTGQPVAQLTCENDQLAFQWLTDDAVRDAEYLRNCLLKPSLGTASTTLALRTPVQVESLRVDVAKGGGTFKHRLKVAPRATSLGLEITELGKALSNSGFGGSQKLRDGDKVSIKVRGESQQDLFLLQVAFAAERSGEISVTAKPLWPDGTRLDPRQAQQRAAALQANRDLLDAQFRALPARARSPAQQAQFDQQLAAFDKQLAQFVELGDICEKLKTASAFQFRVFMTADGREVDLLATKP